MATGKEYKDYILEQLGLLNGVCAKPMMGEYLLYFDGKLFGGIYDNRLLFKITPTNKKYAMQCEVPYLNAKPMFMLTDIENKELLKEIVLETVNGLK